MKFKKLKRTGLVLLVIFAATWTYVEIANRNSKDMTVRQKLLKAFYPTMMWIAGKTGANTKVLSNNTAEPVVSLYTLSNTLNNGNILNFDDFKGKKIMLVNTASDCGYTKQYEDLQKLSEQYKDKLIIIGFPANDFKEQEKGSDEEIASFCKLNYGVTFPLMKKSSVLQGPEQNKIFEWLSDPAKNGWNKQQPSWNFSKYLVDETGRLTYYFGPTIEPLGEQITSAINQ